jgi:hypothetical protein
MNVKRNIPVFVIVFAAGTLLLCPRPASSNERLDAVKTMFASAEYEGALAALDAFDAEDNSPDADRVVSAQYRALCLVALGRTADAEAAMEQAIRLDPHTVVDEQMVAPRVVQMFRNVRQRVLPGVIQDRFTAARAAFHEGSADAPRLFEEVVSLSDDAVIKVSNPELANNVRLLAEGFLDLLQAQVAAEPAPVETAAAAPAAPAAPAPVVEARPVSEVLPPWPLAVSPPDTVGRLELVIDAQGRVEKATMLASIHPLYDLPLLQAARGWQYQPATQAGRAIQSRRVLSIRIRQP